MVCGGSGGPAGGGWAAGGGGGGARFGLTAVKKQIYKLQINYNKPFPVRGSYKHYNTKRTW